MTGAEADGPLVTQVDDGVATLWLNRPDKRNAVTFEMWNGIADICREWADDASVLAVVVRGVGDHFCAGADVGGMARVSPDEYAAANAAADDAIAELRQPTIAVVRGSCVGGGVGIAAAADLRIADSTARFGVTPARLGIVYPHRALERVVRLIGPSAAKHLLVSAELIDSTRALRIGLVDEVHETVAALERVETFTRLIAHDRSLFTQLASIEMIDEISTAGSVSARTVERWERAARTNSDAPEGIAAFIEKRRPSFDWRPGDMADNPSARIGQPRQPS